MCPGSMVCFRHINVDTLHKGDDDDDDDDDDDNTVSGSLTTYLYIP
jgi:hypothetical protein